MDDATLARLLSEHDEPSVLEKEALFERVVDELDTAKRRRLAWWLAVPALAAAAAVALFVVTPSHPTEELAARGTLHRSHTAIVCVETGVVGRCPSGGTLAFDVRANDAAPYVAAFAIRGEETLWFFPTEGKKSPRAAAGESPELLPQGIRLDQVAPPGDYEVYVVFSARPLGREEIKAALGSNLHESPGVEVVREPFTVERSP